MQVDSEPLQYFYVGTAQTKKPAYAQLQTARKGREEMRTRKSHSRHRNEIEPAHEFRNPRQPPSHKVDDSSNKNIPPPWNGNEIPTQPRKAAVPL